MKLETILKVIEIIQRSGEQSKHICMDDEYCETYSVKFHILVLINCYTHNCHVLYRITVYCMQRLYFIYKYKLLLNMRTCTDEQLRTCCQLCSLYFLGEYAVAVN